MNETINGVLSYVKQESVPEDEKHLMVEELLKDLRYYAKTIEDPLEDIIRAEIRARLIKAINFDPSVCHTPFGEHRTTVLYEAIRLGLDDIVNTMLDLEHMKFRPEGKPCTYVTERDFLMAVQQDKLSLDTIKRLNTLNYHLNISDRHGVTPLMHAAQKGRMEVVEYLLAESADISAKDRYGWTAFDHAVRNNIMTPELLKKLHSPEQNINSGPITPLICVAANGNVEVAEYLLANGAKLELTDSRGDTAFHIAVKRNPVGVELLEKLWLSGMDIDKGESGLFAGRTPLMHAAMNANVEVMDYLLAKGADITVADGNGDTAFNYAFWSKHESVELLEKLSYPGQDINRGPFTPLMHAAANGNVEVMDYLLANGADLTKTDRCGRTAFGNAVRHNHLNPEQLEKLWSPAEDINSNQPGSSSITPLMNAASESNVEVVDYLIAKGADINVVDCLGRTAFFHMIRFGKPSKELLAKLWTRKQDINFVEPVMERTPLMYAAGKGDAELVAYLLAKGADKEVVNKRGQTAFDIAVLHNKANVELLKTLLPSDSNMNLADNRGLTPLMHAVKTGDKAVILFLLNANANANANANPEYVAFNGTTVSSHAREAGHLGLYQQACKQYMQQQINLLLQNYRSSCLQSLFSKRHKPDHIAVAAILRNAVNNEGLSFDNMKCIINKCFLTLVNKGTKLYKPLKMLSTKFPQPGSEKYTSSELKEMTVGLLPDEMLTEESESVMVPLVGSVKYSSLQLEKLTTVSQLDEAPRDERDVGVLGVEESKSYMAP
ncbi:MAG: ankyrin repeat domain-containing protein [Coxiellaceae bacterium]|nr:ankyrin repeat domain-containing protein [Coxiellaceae bacterium]